MTHLEKQVLEQIERGALAERDDLFNSLALEIFTRQYESIETFQRYCKRNGVHPEVIDRFQQIPPFPTAAFKFQNIATFDGNQAKARFLTSGTSTDRRGVHLFLTLKLYNESSLQSFLSLTPRLPSTVSMLSLIPSPQKDRHSSLAHMVGLFSKKCFQKTSYVNHRGNIDFEKAVQFLIDQSKQAIPIMIASTSVGLSDLLEHIEAKNLELQLPAGSRLFETGGRKGRRSAISTPDLMTRAERYLDIPPSLYLGEYGMTESSSPAWGSVRNGKMIYTSPTWCPVRIADPETWAQVPDGNEGMITLFDLANLDSVSSLATGDWGRRHGDSFEVLGRLSDRELRGCSLQVSQDKRKTTSKRDEIENIGRAKEEVLSAEPISIERSIRALGVLSQIWSSPNHSMRKDFEAEFVALSGWAQVAVSEGLSRTFSELSEEKLRTACKQKWPEERPSFKKKLSVYVHAGNLPVTGVFSFFQSLLVGNPSLHRISSRGGTLLVKLIETLRKIDADLAQRCTILHSSSDDTATTQLLFKGAHEVRAQGNKLTLKTLSALVSDQTTFYGFGPKLSFGILPKDVELDSRAIRCFLEDIYIWEQQGCLSPQVLFVTTENKHEFDRTIRVWLDEAEFLATLWRRDAIAKNTAHHVWLRMEDEIRETENCLFHCSKNLTIVQSDIIRPEWFSTPGLVQFVPVLSFGDIGKHLNPFKGMIGSCSVPLQTFGKRETLGFNRQGHPEQIVPFGKLQSPRFQM